MWININKDTTFQLQNKYNLLHHPKTSIRKNQVNINTQPSEIHRKAIIGSKAILYSKTKKVLGQQRNMNNQHQHSNFQMLKRKISQLENEKPLGNHSLRNDTKIYEQNGKVEHIPQGEFFSSKKLSLFQKYKLNLKKNNKRKLSYHLITNNSQRPTSKIHQSLPQRIETQSCQIKKRDNISQCAKRYFGASLYKQNMRYLGSVENVVNKNGSSLSLISLH